MNGGAAKGCRDAAWLNDWAALALGTHVERTDSQTVAPAWTLPCVLALPRSSRETGGARAGGEGPGPQFLPHMSQPGRLECVVCLCGLQFWVL